MRARFLRCVFAGAIGVLAASGFAIEPNPVAAAANAAASAPALPGRCDRECLNGIVDQYLAALVAHDPSKAPIAKTAKYTENGQRLEIGDGMWGVASDLGTYKLYFDDPQAGQVGYFGVVKESDVPAVLALRLKVVNLKITEIEAIISRDARGAENLEKTGEPAPIFSAAVPPSDQRPRNEMISIANSYFEGLVQATGKLTPFDPDCTRIENGSITANNPNAPSAMGKLTCGQQFDTGFSTFIKKIGDRRFPIVDEERGLVYSVIFFMHPGTVKSVTLTDGSTLNVSPAFRQPFEFEIGELFKIQNGKIMRVQAVLLAVPYGMTSGWDRP